MENDSHHTLHDKVYSILQVNETEAKHWLHNVRFGLDYQLSEGNSLHTAYTGSFQTKGNTTTRSKGNYSDSESFRTSQEQMHNVNLDYTAAFGLNVGLDYTHFNSPSTQDFTNYLNTEKQHFLVDERQTIDRWNVYAGQNHDLPQGWELNYGINFTFAREKADNYISWMQETTYRLRTQILTCGKKPIISMQERRSLSTISYPCLYRLPENIIG